MWCCEVEMLFAASPPGRSSLPICTALLFQQGWQARRGAREIRALSADPQTLWSCCCFPGSSGAVKAQIVLSVLSSFIILCVHLESLLLPSLLLPAAHSRAVSLEPCLLCKDGQHPVPEPFSARILWMEKPCAFPSCLTWRPQGWIEVYKLQS